MTGRVRYTPEAEQQLNELDEWITAHASTEVASRFVRAIMGHCDDILVFPHAGRRRDDVRPGMQTTTHRNRTTIAYEVAESSGETVVTILGIFHAGQDWETALRPDAYEEQEP